MSAACRALPEGDQRPSAGEELTPRSPGWEGGGLHTLCVCMLLHMRSARVTAGRSGRSSQGGGSRLTPCS